MNINVTITPINGQYLPKEVIAEGGMAKIMLCRDIKDNSREVILKGVPKNDTKLNDALEREYNNLRSLKHPGIVSVREKVEDEDYNYAYLVLEYIPGETLDVYLEKHTNPRPSIALEVLRLLAETLDYVKSQGMVHKDVKPSNVIVAIDENSVKYVKLLDFGMCAPINEKGGAVQNAVPGGTPAYMAPEQFRGVFSATTDQYALAVIAYEMLSGKRFDRFRPIEDLPPYINYALQKGMAESPDERFENCTDFVNALREAPPEPYTQVQPKNDGMDDRFKLLLILLGLLLLFAAVRNCQSKQPQPQPQPQPQAPKIENASISPDKQHIIINAIFDKNSQTNEYSFNKRDWVTCNDTISISKNKTINVIVYFRSTNKDGLCSPVTEYLVPGPDPEPPRPPQAPKKKNVIISPDRRYATIHVIFDKDSQTNEYSSNGDDWVPCNDNIIIYKNGTVYFRSKNKNGHFSPVTECNVTDIAEPPKPTTPPPTFQQIVHDAGDILLKAHPSTRSGKIFKKFQNLKAESINERSVRCTFFGLKNIKIVFMVYIDSNKNVKVQFDENERIRLRDSDKEQMSKQLENTIISKTIQVNQNF